MDNIIIKFLTNESSQDENETLLRWIEESEHNRKYFNSIQKIFISAKINSPLSRKEKAEAVKLWQKIVEKRNSKQQNIFRKRKFSFYYISVAAVILLFVILGINRYFDNISLNKISEAKSVTIIKPSDPTLILSDGREISLSESTTDIEDAGVKITKENNKVLDYSSDIKNVKGVFNTIRIPIATTYQVILSDGTKVWLNSESESTYPVVFTGAERRVTLTGEAYFEVNKSKKPFIVESGNIQSRVLGTSFNVSCYAEDRNQHITLIEGSVKVEIDNDQVILSAGDQMRYNRATHAIIKEQVNVNEYISWLDGQTWFNNTPLNELLIVIKRFYGINVKLSDDTLSKLIFSGKLTKSYDIIKIIDLITESADLRWKVEGDSIILYQ